MSERADNPAPVAPRRPHQWERPTGTSDDPYAWMRNTDDPEFLAYLEAENAHTDTWFSNVAQLVNTIDGEIRSRIQETDVSAPMRHGPWFYASRTVEGLPYPIMCRARTALDAVDAEASITLLDVNVEAAGTNFFDLGAFEPDPTHRLIAWSADTSGDEHHTLRFRDTDTGTDLDDRIEDTAAAGVAWSSDSSTVFYMVADETERPYQVKSHRIGTDPTDDLVLWTEEDERFYVGLGATRSGRWIVIHSGSKNSSEVHLISTSDVGAAPICVQRRHDGVEYHVDDWGDRFVIMTNDGAEDFRLMTAPHDTPSEWTELDPHQPGRRITGVEPFDGVLAVHEWLDAQPRIRLLAPEGSERIIDLGDEPHDLEFGPNEEFNTDRIRIVHQSLTSPATIFDVVLSDLSLDLVRRVPTPNVDLDHYRSQRRWATAPDGRLVPYDLVHHRDTPLDGSAPAVVYAYGAYEVSVPPWFSAGRLSLLDRGVIWVLAHPRGGGELGRRWYLDGRLEHKRNTFTDVLAVADDLDTSGIADPNRLAVRGGSAGGLMVGACVTMRPERFSTAVAEVPFVDVVSTMSDPTLPLTVTEWEEWGDPRTEPYAKYIESYSPYDNTDGKTFGSMLVTAGLNDPRVSVHEPAKWVARIRSHTQHRGPLLLRTEMGAGHAGPSDRYAAWREEAMTLAFILETI
ncbi:MAG: S9 family peptidase [Actinomycetota bacterium]|nr:S9 family peptidase [Actinomycetota bacterium]